MRSWPFAILLVAVTLSAAAEEPTQMSATARAIEAGAQQPVQRLEPDPVKRRTSASTGISDAEIRAAALPAASSPAAKVTTEPAISKPRHARRTRNAAHRREPHALPRYVSTSGGIVIEIADVLGDDQTAEQLSLFLEGRRVADFELDDRHREAELQIPLPSPGRLRYQLLGATDSVRRGLVDVHHRGCIDIQPGGRYSIRRTGTSLTLTARR